MERTQPKPNKINQRPEIWNFETKTWDIWNSGPVVRENVTKPSELATGSGKN